MNQAHYHLILNHLPIIIPMIGLLVMIGGFVVRSEIIKRAAYFIFILGAILTIPAFLTGEGAEEVLEDLPGVSEQFIKSHEEIAETFAILSYLLGAISLAGLWANWQKKSFTNSLAFITIATCVLVLFFAQQTATSGGEIRHTEIRSGKQANPEKNERNKEKDDD